MDRRDFLKSLVVAVASTLVPKAALAAIEPFFTESNISHAITLPSNVAKGDLLISLVAFDDKETQPQWPAGWTELTTERHDETCLSVGWKTANNDPDLWVATDKYCMSTSVTYAISEGEGYPAITDYFTASYSPTN